MSAANKVNDPDPQLTAIVKELNKLDESDREHFVSFFHEVFSKEETLDEFQSILNRGTALERFWQRFENTVNIILIFIGSAITLSALILFIYFTFIK